MQTPRKAAIVSLSLLLMSPHAIAQQADGAANDLRFESATVRPSPSGAHAAGLDWMLPGLNRVPPPHGLLTMTAPVSAFISFAFNLKEAYENAAAAENLPEWTKNRMYTVVARPSGTPGIEEIRTMTRTMLRDRFALRTSEEGRKGPVNKIILVKTGVLGPRISPHKPEAICEQRDPEEGESESPKAGSLGVKRCGISITRLPDSLLHFDLTDVPISDVCKLLSGLGGVAGSRAGRPTVDGTGLSGTFNLTLEFAPEPEGPAVDTEGGHGGPTFTSAMEKQLGMRIEKAIGIVRVVRVIHIEEPTPN